MPFLAGKAAGAALQWYLQMGLLLELVFFVGVTSWHFQSSRDLQEKHVSVRAACAYGGVPSALPGAAAHGPSGR